MTVVEFDPFSSTFFDDPYDMYRSLRDEAPVYFNDRYGFYALSRYDDVVAAHKDWQTYSSSHGVDLNMLTSDPAMAASMRSIIMMDPPAHDTFRALVSRVFTPRAIAGLEPMVREVVGGYCDAIGDRDAFDAVGDLSGPFPVEVISIMMGIPPGERQQIRHSVDLLLARKPGQMAPSAEGIDAALHLGLYFYELAAKKRAQPTDDLMTRLTQARVAGEGGEETFLDDQEIGFAVLLAGARRPSPSSSPTPSCCSTGTRSSGSSWSTIRRWSPPPSRRSSGSCPRPSTRAGSPCATSGCTARRSRRASRSCC